MKQVIATYEVEKVQEGSLAFKQVEDLLEEDHSTSSFKDIPYSRSKVRKVLSFCCDNKDGIAVIIRKDGEPVGVLMAVVEEPVFSDKKIAREQVWYTKQDPKATLILYKILKQWSLNKGLDTIMMSHHKGLSTDSVDKFLKREGFIPFETHYLGNL